MPDDYQIPDDPDEGKMDGAYLRSCLGMRCKLGETPSEFPMAVKQAHYDMARSLSILGARGNAGMDPTQIATVVALALRDGVEPQEPEGPAYSFIPLVESGEVAPGDKVVIHWRNRDRPAHFIQVIDDRVIVLCEGDERSIRQDLVRFPTEDEFPDVAENINGPTEPIEAEV
jgi:hypothetical protein